MRTWPAAIKPSRKRSRVLMSCYVIARCAKPFLALRLVLSIWRGLLTADKMNERERVFGGKLVSKMPNRRS